MYIQIKYHQKLQLNTKFVGHFIRNVINHKLTEFQNIWNLNINTNILTKGVKYVGPTNTL